LSGCGVPSHEETGAYKKVGFEEVILMPRSGDYGRDVIAIKKGLGLGLIIDQVKAYNPSHLVNANDVRATRSTGRRRGIEGIFNYNI
jgi:hypothetical protein